jgi:hypothetical protein
MSVLLRIGAVILVLCIVSSILEDSAAEKDVRAKKDEFLGKYNPALKTVRQQLLTEVKNCDETIEKLQRMQRGFQQQSAKDYVQPQIDACLRQKQSLDAELARVETEVEKGVALKEFNSGDAGGQLDKDLSALINKAQASIHGAREMNSNLAQSFGQKPASLSTSSSNAADTSYVGSDVVRPGKVALPEMNPARIEAVAKANWGATPHVNPLPRTAHTWTNIDGRSIEAELAAYDGSFIVLKRQDGAIYTYPLEKLSQESRLLAKVLSQSLPKKSEADDGHTKNASEKEELTYRVIRTVDGYVSLRNGPGLGYQPIARIPGSSRGIVQTGELIYNPEDATYWMPARYSKIEGYVSSRFLQPE